VLTAPIRYAGRVMTQAQLLEEFWGRNSLTQRHYLRVYMAPLRHQLERDPTRPRLVTTESGVAYL
jgi:two-component system KDP operon response regulator KdpE